MHQGIVTSALARIEKVQLARAFAHAATLARGGHAAGTHEESSADLGSALFVCVRSDVALWAALRRTQAARQELTKLLCVPVNLGFNVTADC